MTKMYELQYFNGYDYTTFNIIDSNGDRKEIMVAVTHNGKISVLTYDLLEDKNGFYFEYGPLFDRIRLDNFEFLEA